ncbi:MAG: hypothetical protein ACK4IY_07875, partial [Chitinophagales bacterium]
MKRFFWESPEHIYFDGHKIMLWDRWYWMLHYVVIKLPFKLYYAHFTKHNWKNVPVGKPILFASSHRNAFMDSLSFVATENTQVFQLARGDAFSSKTLKRAFYFFHMLPIWRERDKAGNRNISNEPTFAACYELLS